MIILSILITLAATYSIQITQKDVDENVKLIQSSMDQDEISFNFEKKIDLLVGSAIFSQFKLKNYKFRENDLSIKLNENDQTIVVNLRIQEMIVQLNAMVKTIGVELLDEEIRFKLNNIEIEGSFILEIIENKCQLNLKNNSFDKFVIEKLNIDNKINVIVETSINKVLSSLKNMIKSAIEKQGIKSFNQKFYRFPIVNRLPEPFKNFQTKVKSFVIKNESIEMQLDLQRQPLYIPECSMELECDTDFILNQLRKYTAEIKLLKQELSQLSANKKESLYGLYQYEIQNLISELKSLESQIVNQN